jgi:hypothetical protein
MACSFSDDKSRCYICGEYLHKEEQAFLLQRSRVNQETNRGDEHWIDLWKNGSARFVAHAACQNEILFERFNPRIKLDKEYYAYITLGYKNNKKIWRLGNNIIKDNCTQDELNQVITKFAKDLLNGKVKGF